MDPWPRSDVSHSRMEGLVKKGLLRARTPAAEWLVPGGKDAPSPPDGYVISFVPFHERRLAMPPHRFLRGLLHYYKIELHHLNPNGVQHISAFVALCEGFLGVEPHFELWKFFFSIDLQRKNIGPGRVELNPESADPHTAVLPSSAVSHWPPSAVSYY